MSIELDEKGGDSCVIFDGQCPFCRAYVASLEGNNGTNKARVAKIDARYAPKFVEQLADKGIDINAGIILIKGDSVFQDAEALTLLAKQHAASGYFIGLHHHLLRYKLLSRAIYPLLRALRNAYLRSAGQTPIKTKVDKI